MSAVEIENVVQLPLAKEHLVGRHIDSPKAGSTESFAAIISGWVLALRPVIGVEVVQDREVLRRVAVDIPRPDVAVAFPKVHENGKSGFRICLNLLTVGPELNLTVQAVLEGEVRVPLGTIRGRRREVRSGFEPRLQPLMLTTLGRTGSTWVTRLLGQHPRIVAYRPFEFEPRVASYWMAVLQALTEPVSYMQALTAVEMDPNWWLGTPRGPRNVTIPDESVRSWVCARSLESVAGFCQGQLEEFYQQAAAAQNQPEASYFVEKYMPNAVLRAIWSLYPRARQIVLVRDLRDMLCSIFAFNAKRGYKAFGRDRVSTDEDYILKLRADAEMLLRAWKRREKDSYLLRYEDIILRQDETLRSVLSYLELPSDADTIRRMIEGAQARTPEFQTYHRTSPDSKQSVGRWRRDLDPQLQILCRESFNDILSEFGYALDEEPQAK
jgi:hypothetical protein